MSCICMSVIIVAVVLLCSVSVSGSVLVISGGLFTSPWKGEAIMWYLFPRGPLSRVALVISNACILICQLGLNKHRNR